MHLYTFTIVPSESRPTATYTHTLYLWIQKYPQMHTFYKYTHTDEYHSAFHYSIIHCTTLQHTAPHCNTLHHTATHCNTLQHTATHEYHSAFRIKANRHIQIEQCSDVWKFSKVSPIPILLQYTATHCNTLQQRATASVYASLQIEQSGDVWKFSKVSEIPILCSTCGSELTLENLYNSSSEVMSENCDTGTHCNTLQHTATARNRQCVCQFTSRAVRRCLEILKSQRDTHFM